VKAYIIKHVKDLYKKQLNFSYHKNKKMTLPIHAATDLESTPPAIPNFDFAKKQTAFDNGAKSMVYDLFKADGKFFHYTFPAILASESIVCTQFDGNANFSMVVQLENENDTKILEDLNVVVAQVIPDVENWTPTTILKDDAKIFVKLKYDNKKTLNLKPISNLPINLKKPMDTKLFQGQEVDITCQLGFYINFNQKTYGASLNPVQFDFKSL